MITFSAIVPNYNDSATLPQTLDSLLAQTSPFDEILVIDDGSTDGSREIIADYAARYPIIRALPNEKNMGVIATLNRGIGLAMGEFIINCSSNDWYEPREVEYCRAALAAFPKAQMVCGNINTWNATKNAPGNPHVMNLPPERRCYMPDEYVQENKRTCIYFNGPAIALRRSAVLEFGSYRAELRWHTDWLLYLLFAFRFPFVYVPEIFATLRVDEGCSYSEGRFRWREQREVTQAMLRILKQEYPDIAARARQAAMLPKYDLHTLALLLRKENRWFITPLVLWRIGMYSVFFWMRRYFPRSLLMAIRRYVKV